MERLLHKPGAPRPQAFYLMSMGRRWSRWNIEVVAAGGSSANPTHGIRVLYLAPAKRYFAP